jgi:single-strand DNA-binding protein
MQMLNRIELIGYLGRDPKFTPENGNKRAYATVTIATSDKRGDEKITEWNNLVFFGKAAETINRYTQKGTLMYVAGKLTTRKYTDKQGNTQEVKCIIVNDFQMLGNKSDRDRNRQQQQTSQQTQQYNTADSEDPFGNDGMPF